MIELCIEECMAKGRWSDIETQKEKDEKVSESPQSKIFDPVDKLIDFHSVRATELKSNKRVNIVEHNDLLHETKCEFLKIKMMETTRKWMNEHDNLKYSNLSEDLRQGLDELLENVNNKKAVVFETDKSKKFSVNTPDGFRSDMKVHIEKINLLTKSMSTR